MATSPLIYDPYVIRNVEGSTFLDVGCGNGKWGFLLKKHRLPDAGIPVRVTGIDLRREGIEQLARHAIYDELHVGDARALPFADGAFASVVACEVIEHIPAEEGPKLMRELRRVASRCVIVSTPNAGELRKGYDVLEDHVSSYDLRAFHALGFTQVIGLGRLRVPSWKLGILLAPLGLFLPRRSRFLMGFWFADGRKRELYAE